MSDTPEAEPRNPNLALWDSVSKTDEKFITDVVIGSREFKAIDAYHQLEQATRMFGPCGAGWGYKHEYVSWPSIENPQTLLCYVTLFYTWQDARHELTVTGTASLFNSKGHDQDAWKKSLTDGLTKALSYLGFNADVFQGKLDANKYVHREDGEEERQNGAGPKQNKRANRNSQQRSSSKPKADPGDEQYSVTSAAAKNANEAAYNKWPKLKVLNACGVLMAESGYSQGSAKEHLKAKHNMNRCGDVPWPHAVNLFKKARVIHEGMKKVAEQPDAAVLVDMIREKFPDPFDLTPEMLNLEIAEFRTALAESSGAPKEVADAVATEEPAASGVYDEKT